MREKKIEQKLVTAVKKHGGICPKFVSPGFDGMPDRLLLLPHGRFAFVEVKAPNQKPRPLQLSRHRLLRRLGFQVYVLDALEDIDKIILEVKKRWNYMIIRNMQLSLLKNTKIAALLLDMGLGKTITTLTAINNLIYDLFEVRKVLIIAPLRVARDTWSAEVQNGII